MSARRRERAEVDRRQRRVVDERGAEHEGQAQAVGHDREVDGLRRAQDGHGAGRRLAPLAPQRHRRVGERLVRRRAHRERVRRQVDERAVGQDVGARRGERAARAARGRRQLRRLADEDVVAVAADRRGNTAMASVRRVSSGLFSRKSCPKTSAPVLMTTPDVTAVWMGLAS